VFKNYGIKAKLMLSFGFIAMMLLTVGAISYFSFDSITKNYGHVVDVNFSNARNLTIIRGKQKDVVISVNELVGQVTTKEQADREGENIEATAKAFDQAGKNYLANPFQAGEEEMWADVVKNWTPFIEMSRKFVQLSATGNKADQAMRDHLAETEYKTLRKNFVAALTKLIDFQESDGAKWQAKAKSVSTSAKLIINISVCIGFFLSLLIGFFLSQSLSNTLTEIADQLSSGSVQVSAAARQIAGSSEELSAAVTEQAASLEQTSASIEQINAMISKNAENAKQSTVSSQQARENVSAGQTAIASVSKAINLIQEGNSQISKQTETSNREFAEIVQVIGEIGNKTKIINEIVFQTKLLSFNASVEAARAGEHGKGFAVVAEEVGNLAQMSGNAAKEISDMLASSIQRVEGIVNKSKAELSHLISSGKTQVEDGSQVAHRCEELFNHIVKSVKEVDQMAGEISSASQEQTQGVQEVTRAIAQLSHVNSQNATSSGQAASAAEQLAAQSHAMAGLVSRLVQTVRGSNGDPSGSSSSSAQERQSGHRKASNSKTSQGKSTSAKGKSQKSDKVVSLHSKKSFAGGSAASAQVYKKAAGSDVIPSENDDRFEDM
jgi:methyl-accepting chemotaxis protein